MRGLVFPGSGKATIRGSEEPLWAVFTQQAERSTLFFCGV